MVDVNEVEINQDFYFLNTGSPHYVAYVENISSFAVFEEGSKIRNNDRFKEQGKVGALILAQLDEEEIRLRQELEDNVKKSFDEAVRIGIPISTLLLERMKLELHNCSGHLLRST